MFAVVYEQFFFYYYFIIYCLRIDVIMLKSIKELWRSSNVSYINSQVNE